MIVLLVVAGLVVLAFAITAPMMRKRESAAMRRATEAVGGSDAVELSSSRVVGFGTEPAEAGGLRGMGVLVASSAEVVFVSWAPQEELRIPRAELLEVQSQTANAHEAPKALIQLRYRDIEHGEVVAGFRLARAGSWLDELAPATPT